ncbi:MAG: RDD family protein [bacterium]|nr:RDD family protein [bacterium]
MEQPPEAPRHSDAAILGLDNVRLDLPLANLGSRTLAASLDHFLLFLLQAIWIVASLTVMSAVGLAGGWVVGLVVLGFFLLQWGYFAAFEIALAGQTPGKVAVGLRVVSTRGGRTTAAAILIRNFIRTIDLLVGVPIMAIDRRARRLGDLVAGTLVVHHREDTREEALLGRHPAGWGAREVSVVESFLRRVELMDAAASERLADQLLRWIEGSEPAFWAEIEPGLVTSGNRVLTLRQALEARL